MSLCVNQKWLTHKNKNDIVDTVRKRGKHMAVKLRLKRMGTKKRPFYRVVAADSRSPRDGRIIETVGTYNPIMEPAEVKIDEEKAMRWLANGAEPTDTVRDLLRKQGILAKVHQAKMTKKEGK